METLCVRLITCDFYMDSPKLQLDPIYSEFRASTIIQVPVIRIFGPTDSGDNVCVHVHGVFPYIYVPYDGKEDIILLRQQIALMANTMVNGGFGQTCSISQPIYDIRPVSAIPLYGYHFAEHQFLQIYLYNPVLISSISDLLHNSTVLGRKYEPYESHISYIMRFMIDYNLHGMGVVRLRNVKVRNASCKITSCPIEVDVLASDILNFSPWDKTVKANPGIAAIWKEEKQRRNLDKCKEQLDAYLSLSENQSIIPSDSHISWQNALIKTLKNGNGTLPGKVGIVVYPAETKLCTQSLSVLEGSISLDDSLITFNLHDDVRTFYNALAQSENINISENDSALSQYAIEPKETEDFEDNLNLTMESITLLSEDDLCDTVDVNNEFPRPGENLANQKHNLQRPRFIDADLSEKIVHDLRNDQVNYDGSNNLSITKQDAGSLVKGNADFVDTSISTILNQLLPSSMQCTTSELGAKTHMLRKLPAQRSDLCTCEKLQKNIIQSQMPLYRDMHNVIKKTETGFFSEQSGYISRSNLAEFTTAFGTITRFRLRIFQAEQQHSYRTLQSLSLSYCDELSILIQPLKQAPLRYMINSNIPPGRCTLRSLEMNAKVFDTCKSLANSLNTKASTGLLFQAPNNASDNTAGKAKLTGHLQIPCTISLAQHISILVMEVYVQTREDFQPDPYYDAIFVIFFEYKAIGLMCNSIFGAIGQKVNKMNLDPSIVFEHSSELEIIECFIDMVLKWNPDVLCGYEIEMHSWGYLLERSKYLGINAQKSLSRITEEKFQNVDKWPFSALNQEPIKIAGRIALDVWRLIRHEINLISYTFENVYFHVLHQRIARLNYRKLSELWNNASTRSLLINYYKMRVSGTLKMLDQLDLLNRTAELAKLFGIQWFEVWSRGSQYRVESMMIRLARSQNFICSSPSVEQKTKMKAPESLPLILEPESKLLLDPVVVLDFQSLYPSIMIAYNYCYSTCIGRVELLNAKRMDETPFEFGATHLKISQEFVQQYCENDLLNYSPIGVAFVKASVRKGILPTMLTEILYTRMMLKSALKSLQSDLDNNTSLKNSINNRQLGLKLIANVTYGYTSANYSGRMPAVELSDSILSKARETLERAIALVNTHSNWNARVIYGDTDSIFVLLKGRSRKDAFRIGMEIANAVTAQNPKPLRLKFEKVYHPCLLQTKKRYVGYMYENSEQQKPLLESKGIETIRRDGCPATMKILEKSIKMLFDARDLASIKSYITRQFQKILAGHISVQELTFSKEYRGRNNYKKDACVPALQLVRKWTLVDRRMEPRCGERVPYVIINGPPNVPMIELVRTPIEVLRDQTMTPNAIYYISKAIIPPLNRCFKLLGVDVAIWFAQTPRTYFEYNYAEKDIDRTSIYKQSWYNINRNNAIGQYFPSVNCALCKEPLNDNEVVCKSCKSQSQKSCLLTLERIRYVDKTINNIHKICRLCHALYEDVVCESLDCPILYRYYQIHEFKLEALHLRQLIREF